MKRLLLAIVVLDLVLVLAGLVLSLYNQGLRREVAQRQQTINQGLTYSQINQYLVNALTGLAVRNGDERVRALLSKNGVNITPNPPPPKK